MKSIFLRFSNFVSFLICTLFYLNYERFFFYSTIQLENHKMHYFVQYAYLCTISILLYVRYNMHYFVQYAYFCSIFIRFLQNAYFCTNCILFKWVTRIRDVLCLLGNLIISVQHCTQCLTLCTTVHTLALPELNSSLSEYWLRCPKPSSTVHTSRQDFGIVYYVCQ